jgi:hypothetical protein
MIKCIRATTKDITLKLTNKETNLPINLTGYTLWFTVRKDIPRTTVNDDDSAVISKKQLPGEILDPTNGETMFSLSRNDTNIDPMEYVYDLQIKTDTGLYQKIHASKFIITGDVTRSE